MSVPKETFEMRIRIFNDYCNQRDRIKLAMQKESVSLTRAQSDRILNMAKKVFQDRELDSSKAWLSGLMDGLEKYFTSIKISSWPMFNRR